MMTIEYEVNYQLEDSIAEYLFNNPFLRRRKQYREDEPTLVRMIFEYCQNNNKECNEVLVENVLSLYHKKLDDNKRLKNKSNVQTS